LLSLAVVLVLLIVNYSLNVVELVLLLLVVNYVVDLMMCVILVLCMIYPVYSDCFGGSSSGEATKTISGKKIKLLYSSVN
jgi:hypothetical protein